MAKTLEYQVAQKDRIIAEQEERIRQLADQRIRCLGALKSLGFEDYASHGIVVDVVFAEYSSENPYRTDEEIVAGQPITPKYPKDLPVNPVTTKEAHEGTTDAEIAGDLEGNG